MRNFFTKKVRRVILLELNLQIYSFQDTDLGV